MQLHSIIFVILLLGLAFTAKSNGQTINPSNSSANQISEDKPLEIKSKPPAYSRGGCDQTNGVVRLRVTFDKSKKVKDAEIVKSSGCERFDRNALAAAKKIKFNPALKNGEPVTVTKLVEYTFEVF